MIAIEKLEFRYADSDFRLSIAGLSIDRGAKVAFVGPSGSGKTTLLHLVGGILVPLRGRIRVGGVELSRLPDGRRRDFRIARIGFVFQDFELIDYLNVRENILLPFLINGSLALDTNVRKAAADLAGSMGIGDKLNRRIGHLSQGEKQRVAICRALLPGPRLLLADEPTGNLDPANKRRIIELLFDRAARTGATLLAVTHDHSLLGNLDRGFDRVIDFRDFLDSPDSPPPNSPPEG